MEASPRVQLTPSRQSAPSPAKGQIALKETVADRAYQIWLSAGCPHGQHEAHWYQAERELRSHR